MKKIIICLLLILLVGCSSKENVSLDTPNVPANSVLDIEDIDWEVYYALKDSDTRYMHIDFTNNSDYIVGDIEIKFREKDGDHLEAKEMFYKYVEEFVETEEDKKDLEELKESEFFLSSRYSDAINPGETITESLVFFYGYMLVPYQELYDICEPDYINISYIVDNEGYELTYDYLTNKASIKDLGPING